jgi:putative membrane protein
MLVVDTWLFLAAQFSYSYLLGSFFALLVLSVLGAAGVLSWRSWQKLQRFRQVADLQREGERLMLRNGYGQARPYVNRIAHIYAQRSDVRQRLDTFQRTVNDSYHDREVCALFSQQVMQDLDQQAYRLVLKRSQETALMVMVSPIPLLDALLTLWRNLRMIRDIATLYGGRPGALGSMSLTLSVIQNLIYADVSEVVADGLAETLGNSMLAVLSTQAAQGIGSGILTARVGVKAMQACRPLPFTEEERPRLKTVRRELIGSLKRIFERKKTQEAA